MEKRPAAESTHKSTPVQIGPAIVRATCPTPAKLLAALGCVLFIVSEGMEDGTISTEDRDHASAHTEELITALLGVRAALGCTMQGGH